MAVIHNDIYSLCLKLRAVQGQHVQSMKRSPSERLILELNIIEVITVVMSPARCACNEC
jgi:hypothetical protein